MSTAFGFKSPPPKRYVNAWTSPLIAGLKSSASWGTAHDETKDDPLPLVAPPLGEQSSVMTSEDANILKEWLDSEEEKSSVHSNVSSTFSPSPEGTSRTVIRLEETPLNNAAVQSESNPKKIYDTLFGDFSIYETTSPQSDDYFSAVESVEAATIIKPSSKNRPVLADISKNSDVEFVPNSWLTLYHQRPSEDDTDGVKIAWLEECIDHLRPSTMQETPKPPPPMSVHVHNTAASRLSGITVPTALKTTNHRPGSATRSILKQPLNPAWSNLKFDSAWSDEFCGRRGVRFEHPRTAVVKRPIMVATRSNDTPTTWPNYVPDRQGSNTPSDTSNLYFRDIWEEAAGITGFIPYQTPENKSTSSSSSGYISSTSKTTVILSGKENNRSVGSSAFSKSTLSAQQSAKTLPTRPPFLVRSSSKRNIMNGLS